MRQAKQGVNMNIVMKKDGKNALMPEGQKKWSDFPIGAAFPPNGAWKGQPQLVARGGVNFSMGGAQEEKFRAFFDEQGRKHPEFAAQRDSVLEEIAKRKGDGGCPAPNGEAIKRSIKLFEKAINEGGPTA